MTKRAHGRHSAHSNGKDLETQIKQFYEFEGEKISMVGLLCHERKLFAN
jgi:hypothetical protein